MRQERSAEFQLDAAAFGDLFGAADDLRMVSPLFLELSARAQRKILAAHRQSVGVGEHLLGLDAHQGVLGLAVVGIQVVNVNGRHHRQRQSGSELKDFLVDQFLVTNGWVVLNLKVEVAAAKQSRHLFDVLGRFVVSTAQHMVGKSALEAAAQADQALGVGRQQLEINPGFIIKPIEVGDGGQFNQVVVANLVGCQQHEVVRPCVEVGLLVTVAAPGHIGLDAQDRLNAGFPAPLVKLNQAVHDAVISQPKRGHLVLRRPADQLVNFRQAVEQRVVGVNVEVDKRHGMLF